MAEITLGDVWDALDAAGVRPGHKVRSSQDIFSGVATGSAYFTFADGRRLRMPNRGFFDGAAAPSSLLDVLGSWETRPAASGKYAKAAGHGASRVPVTITR